MGQALRASSKACGPFTAPNDLYGGHAGRLKRDPVLRAPVSSPGQQSGRGPFQLVDCCCHSVGNEASTQLAAGIFAMLPR